MLMMNHKLIFGLSVEVWFVFDPILCLSDSTATTLPSCPIFWSDIFTSLIFWPDIFITFIFWSDIFISWYFDLITQCSFHILNFLIWQIDFKSPSSYFDLKSASRGLLNQHFCIFIFWIFIFSFEMMYLRVAGQVCLLGHNFAPIELSSALTPSHFIQQRASQLKGYLRF